VAELEAERRVRLVRRDSCESIRVIRGRRSPPSRLPARICINRPQSVLFMGRGSAYSDNVFIRCLVINI
jgi:hypothetical protein